MICLSYSDGTNKTVTNFTSIRTLLYHARRVFPNARLAVTLGLPTDDLQTSVKENVQELFEMIKEKRPAGCETFSPLSSQVSITMEEARELWEITLLEHFL